MHELAEVTADSTAEIMQWRVSLPLRLLVLIPTHMVILGHASERHTDSIHRFVAVPLEAFSMCEHHVVEIGM